MLNAFKIKDFDLQPIYEQWKDGPVFNGTKKDMPVEDWLEKVREGCVERGVPEEYWYKVAQHFMGPKARARLDELKQVIVKVHGGKYRWTWKKFKVAVTNMGWDIDKDAKETIKVQGKASGLWFMRKKDTMAAAPESKADVEPESNKRSSGSWFTKQPMVEEPEQDEESMQETARRRPTRSATMTGFWPQRMSTTSEKEKELPQRPLHQKANSDSVVIRSKSKQNNDSAVVHGSHSEGGEVTATTQVPAWLLNACTALEYITGEHPKAMSIISAILITAGSIPALPAIAAGAGGAALASSTAHAIGAIAVGVGQALSASVAQQKKQEGHGSVVSH